MIEFRLYENIRVIFMWYKEIQKKQISKSNKKLLFFSQKNTSANSYGDGK